MAEIITRNSFNDMSIQVDENKKQGCYKDILQRILDILTYYSSKHNKALFIRFDVRFPSSYSNDRSNQTFSKFIACFIKFYKRNGLDPAYIWVREQSYEQHQHYHCILLLDGNKIQSYYHVLRQAEEMWGNKVEANHSGLIEFCNKTRSGDGQTNGILIRRNKESFPDIFRSCFHWASYLAKTSTKDSSPLWVREFGSSRIPHGWQIHPQIKKAFPQLAY